MTTPTICADGTILAAGLGLFAINPDGTEKWHFPLHTQRIIYVGIDGTIYSLVDQTLYAIDKNGSLIWQYQTAGGWGSKFVFSPDGKTLYSYYYTGIISFDIVSKTENWRFGNGRVHAALVDSKGNININIEEGNQFKNYSLSESGEIRWEFLHEGYWFEMTMDKLGNIFFGGNYLYSLDYNGQLRFSIPLAGSNSDLVSDIDGNIYIVQMPSDYKLHIRSYTNTGLLRWSIITEQSATPGASAAIAFNKIIVPTWESGIFYSIE